MKCLFGFHYGFDCLERRNQSRKTQCLSTSPAWLSREQTAFRKIQVIAGLYKKLFNVLNLVPLPPSQFQSH